MLIRHRERSSRSHAALLGLAALTIAFAIAAGGATGASASVLCKEEPTGGKCPKGQMYAPEEVLEFTVEHNIFTEEEIFCESSALYFDLKTAGSGTETVKATVSSFSFSECGAVGFSECEVKVENLQYLAEFHWSAGGNGTVVMKEDTSGEPAVLVDCDSGLLKCTFGATGPTFTFTGGSPAVLDANEISFALKADTGLFTCSKTALLDAKFEAGEPAGIWLAKESA